MMGFIGWAFAGLWVVGLIAVVVFMKGASRPARPRGDYERRQLRVYIYARPAQPWDKTKDEFVYFLSATKGMGLVGTLVGETTVSVVVPSQNDVEQQILLSNKLRAGLIEDGYRA